MKLKHFFFGALVPLSFAIPLPASAQAKSTVYLTSTLGQLSPVGEFGKAYQKSLSVTTGIEARLKKSDYYVLGSIEFNNVGYSQQVRDFSSQFLLENTTTPVLLISVNFGRALYFNKARKFFLSPYVGSGFINVSRPQVEITASSQTANVSQSGESGAFGRVGSRIGFNTGKVWLPTILVDGSYWRSLNNPYYGEPAQAYTLMLGTRYGF